MSDDEPTAEDRRKFDEFKQALDTMRDAIGGMAVGVIGENLIERGGRKVAYSVASRSLGEYGTREAIDKATVRIKTQLKENIGRKIPAIVTRNASKLYQRAIATRIAKEATEFFTKNAVGMALKYATKGLISLMDNLTIGMSGCAAGPTPACAVTVFVGIVTTAMDVFFIISDFSDKKGLTVILSKDFIEDTYRDSYTSIMNSVYDEAYPGYNFLEDRVDVNLASLLLTIDEDTGVPVYADNEFAKKFAEYEDEYMRSQGYSSSWRLDALEAAGIVGVQETMDRDLEIFRQNLGIESKSEKKNNNKTLIIVLFIFAIITLIIISYVLLT